MTGRWVRAWRRLWGWRTFVKDSDYGATGVLMWKGDVTVDWDSIGPGWREETAFPVKVYGP